MLCKGNLSTPLIQLSSQASRVCLVSVVNNVVVRAGEERLFWADVKSCSSLSTGVAGVIEPKERCGERHQLLPARVVAVPTPGQVPLLLASLSSSPVALYKDTNIARFHSLATSDGTDAETAEY